MTTELDNMPRWSPDGGRIVLTRKVDYEDYDIFTIGPDGSDLKTPDHPARQRRWCGLDRRRSDHVEQRFLRLQDETALYGNTFQPYGHVWIMDADGSGKCQITDSPWEDSMPLCVPASVCGHHNET